MAEASNHNQRDEFLLAFSMAWIAGSVDAIGFLTLFQLFTSHMTGNSAAMGLDTGANQLVAASARFLPIPIFVAGTLIGAFLAEIGVRHNIRQMFSLAVGLEAALLAGFWGYGASLTRNGSLRIQGGWQFDLLVALPSAAMGLQNALIRRNGRNTLHTTYITGALTNAAEATVAHFFWLRDHTRELPFRETLTIVRSSGKHTNVRKIGLYSGIWFCFSFGALIGGVTQQSWGLASLSLPLAALAAIVVWSLQHPIGAGAVAGGAAQKGDA